MGGRKEIEPIEVHPEIMETDWMKRARTEMERIAGDLDMSDMERAAMDMISQQMARGLPSSYGLAEEELRRTMTDFYDPMESPYYQGLRDAIAREEEEAVTATRRHGQMGGMLGATPTSRAVGDVRATAAGQRGELLGGLYERERDRRTQSIPQLMQVGREMTDLPMRQAAMGMEAGGLPRNIEMQRAGMYGGLMNYQPFYTPDMYYPQYEPAWWEKAMSGIGGMMPNIQIGG